MRIKAEHAVELGYCLSGVKKFCARHGLDFKQLVKEGLTEEELNATHDQMAKTLVEHCRGRQK